MLGIEISHNRQFLEQFGDRVGAVFFHLLINPLHHLGVLNLLCGFLSLAGLLGNRSKQSFQLFPHIRCKDNVLIVQNGVQCLRVGNSLLHNINSFLAVGRNPYLFLCSSLGTIILYHKPIDLSILYFEFSTIFFQLDKSIVERWKYLSEWQFQYRSYENFGRDGSLLQFPITVKSSQLSIGEIFNAHFKLVLGLCSNEGEQHRLDNCIFQCSMTFFKIFLLETIGKCLFRISRIIFAACGSPFIIIAHLLVFRIIQQVFTRQPPQVKQRICFAMKTENIRFKFFLRMGLASVGDCFTSVILICFPLKEIRRIQLGNIKLCKRQSFLKVKHGVICANGFNNVHIFHKLCNCRVPISQLNFSGFQTFQINRSLRRIISGIKDRGNAENLRNEIGRTLVNLTANIHNLPSQIINQRLGDCNIFFLLCGKLCGIRQGSRFTIQNQVILAALVQLNHNVSILLIQSLGLAIASLNAPLLYHTIKSLSRVFFIF